MPVIRVERKTVCEENVASVTLDGRTGLLSFGRKEIEGSAIYRLIKRNIVYLDRDWNKRNDVAYRITAEIHGGSQDGKTYTIDDLSGVDPMIQFSRLFTNIEEGKIKPLVDQKRGYAVGFWSTSDSSYPY